MASEIHHSAGALIEKDGQVLLIDRVKPPFGYAGPAGHIDGAETARAAIIREVKEETGLTVTKCEKVFDELVEWNTCSRAQVPHHWHLFRCEVKGEMVKNDAEAASIGWYPRADLIRLNLEPVWKYWFQKLNLL